MASTPGPTHKAAQEDTRIFLRYDGIHPDAAAVRKALQGALPKEAFQLCHDVRNTRNGIAIHTKNKEDQMGLANYKHQILEASKCRSADISQKWERILFRNVRTHYLDMNMQEVTISDLDIIREVGYHHSAKPTKVALKASPDGQTCDVVIFFITGPLPGGAGPEISVRQTLNSILEQMIIDEDGPTPNEQGVHAQAATGTSIARLAEEITGGIHEIFQTQPDNITKALEVITNSLSRTIASILTYGLENNHGQGGHKTHARIATLPKPKPPPDYLYLLGSLTLRPLRVVFIRLADEACCWIHPISTRFLYFS